MTTRPATRPVIAGYTLVELTLATGVLAAGVAAAASLTMTSSRIEEMNHRKARVIALTEASARLWQLGLSPSQAATLLPGDPALASISFDGGTVVPTDQGAPIADPTTDLGTFAQLSIVAEVTMRDDSSDVAEDGATQFLQEIIVVR